MPFKQHGRQYDLIVFGATGYTGQLTAEHITTHLPSNLNWAVAGRTESKLQTVIDDCKKLNPDRVQPSIELADVNSEESIKALAAKTFILITTVGPYCVYGEKAFKICAELGTHYFDCTGEFPWVIRMIKKYEKTAQQSGALMFPQIGIESAPPDLCTWALTRHVRKKLGALTREVTISIHELNSAPSGGTLASVLSIFKHFTLKEFKEAGMPYAASPVPHSEPSRPAGSILHYLFGSRTVPDLGPVTTSIAGSTDASTVERTWGLLSTTPTRREEFYGPKFKWQEVFRVRNWLHGVVVHYGLMFGVSMLALFPPVRALVNKFIYQPGQGPDREGFGKESIEYRGVAKPDGEVKNNQRAFATATYNGSMYYLTGLFLAQGALTLLEDDTGLGGGIYTPACLGQPFIDRAYGAGFKVDVKTLED